MPDDLRSFLAELDERGLQVRIERRVDQASEAARLMRQLELRGVEGPFTDIAGADAALVYNLIGSRAALAFALDVEPARVCDRFRDAPARRIDPVLVDAPPCQEVVLRRSDADLPRLPLVTHSVKDAGPYITAGAVLAHNPVTGTRKVSIKRMMLVGSAETGIRMMPPAAARRDSVAGGGGRYRPAGRSPAAGTSLPACEDGLSLAGGLRGEPLRLTPGVGVDVAVPADAELVIEGRILAGCASPRGHSSSSTFRRCRTTGCA